ncbi:MAG: hypothetical protein FJZ95_07215, partial [Chloroflexi bacterium]|nr:hypothetical protein [Chloroflexota bacterium]
MRRTSIAGIVSLSILIGGTLVGCASGSDCSDWEAQAADLAAGNDGLKAELGSAQAEIDSMRSELDAAKADYETLKAEWDTLETDHEATSAELETLREDYQALIEDMEISDLRNPTWQELKRFLEADKTDTLTYAADEFDCEGFAITLRDNAARRGFKSAFVALGYGEATIGHALNAFETTDRGLVYVDCTEHDLI